MTQSGNSSKVTWDDEDTRFVLINWSEIRKDLGKKVHLKNKEKAYAYLCQLLNTEKEKSYTNKQVGDKIRNMEKNFREKLDNNSRTGRRHMIISEEEEAAFGSSSSARPEYLLDSNGPGQNYRGTEDEEENELESAADGEVNQSVEVTNEPPPKKKKLIVAQVLQQGIIEKKEQFKSYMEMREKNHKERLEAYNRRTDVLERFLEGA